MNLRKAIKSAVLVGAVSAVVAPGLAVAAAPGGFGTWTDNGTAGISATCGVTACDTGMTETGFLQRQITDAGGNVFIQTVVTGGTGFNDESFVKMGGTGGIAGRGNITDTIGEVVFTGQSTIMTGELKTMMDSKVNLVQSLVDNTGDTFTAGFTFDHNMAMALGGAFTGAGAAGGMYADVTVKSKTGTASGNFDTAFVQNEFSIENNTAGFQAAVDAVSGKERYNLTNVNDGDLAQTVELRNVTGGLLDAGDVTGGQGGSEAFTSDGSINLVLIEQDVTGVGTFGFEHFGGNETAGVVADVIWDGTAPSATAAYDDTTLGNPFTL